MVIMAPLSAQALLTDKEMRMSEPKVKDASPAKTMPLADILDAIEEIIIPEDLDVISSRAREVKRSRQEDEINEGDTVIVSPRNSPTLSALCGGAPRKVLKKTREGLLIIDIGGAEGRISRDKVLLSKRGEDADKR
jgi:hypothetical protein